MIDIQIMPEQFAYDVQSLVKSFYSEHDFKVNQVVDNSYRIVKVYFENEIRFELYDNDKKLFEGYEKCDFSNRKETKNILKKLLYRGMQIDTGKELPWGDLTGIRPAKIPALLYEEGKKEEEIRRYMKETYMISDEKLDLAMYIAKREHEILKDINYKQGYSLYIGIPFCPTRCLYCSFTSYPVSFYKDKTDTYVDALIKEIEYVGSRLKDRELNSVYIGGGTPTTLEPYQLDKLITALKDNFDFSTVKEFTVEAGRPDSITSDKLDMLKKHNVSRISINPQTMNQETLDIIGRRHTVEQVIKAFNLAREKGFDNINMDFIIGLPNETVDMVRHSMEETKKLNPESLTVHSLAVKRAARLNTEKEKYQDYTYENNSKLMNITMDYSKEMNMKPYYLYRQKNMAGNQENVGYSVYGKECLYNILMMGDRQDVFALGAGGTTKIMSEDRLSAKRIDNVKNVDQYIDRIDEMIARKKEYFDKL